jgi:O-antigen/teichoic acid export membrane protein
MESFYKIAGIGEAFLIGGLFVPLMCLPAVDMAVAQKQLNFSRLAILQTIAVVLASVTALGLALTGYHLISLFALQGCIGPYTFVLFRLVGQPLELTRFRMAHVRDVWGIGGHLTFTSVAAVVMQNLPQLIMAKFLTAEALGYYTFSFRIIQLIGTQLGGMVWMVIYPTFSSIQSDLKRVGRVFLYSARYTVFALFLCLLVLVVAPGPFLDLFGGDQWGGGTKILFFLAIMQMLASFGSNVIPTFQAIGKPSAGWKWIIFFSSVQATIVLALARHGVEAVAVGMAVSGLVMPLAPYWLSRVAGFPFADYVRSMAGIVLPVFPAIAVGIALSTWARDLPSLAAFLIPAGAAGIVFVGLIVATDGHLRLKLSELMDYGRKRMAS